MTISRDEWLAAMDDAQLLATTTEPGALTVREFATMFGLGRDAARRRLERLVELGKARKVAKRFRDASGALQRASAYVLEKPNAE